MIDALRAPDAVRLLNRGAGKRLSYFTFWQAIQRGTVPAERVGGRYQIRRSDLPRIAKALGLDEQRI